ncbi:hypothetical protein ACN28I_43525 [Archangium gephyra]|uniref:hypothetical protein n=1 Tax=Archangium gephyra TaxID=48 RepID=UPI003B7DCB1D
MFWKDLRRETPPAEWEGLELTVDGLPAPSWRIQAARGGFLRLVSGGTPLLWARMHPFWDGVWWLRSGVRDTSPLAPIDALELSRVGEEPRSEAWLAAWARHFAGALERSPRSPLHAGTWRLERPRDDSEARAECFTVDRLQHLLEPTWAGYRHWHPTYGSQGVLPLRQLEPGSARVKAWRKSVRDGRLPPVLLLFVSSLDMFVVLDGHDRLTAALLEDTQAPVLVLWHVHAVRSPSRPDVQEGIERGFLRLAQGTGRSPPDARTLDSLNERAIDAWDDRPHTRPRSRGWPLPGGRGAWEHEVKKRLLALGREVDPAIHRALLDP